MTQIPMPAVEIVRKQLRFYWIADHSGSMEGAKLAVLNAALREGIAETRNVAKAHPAVQVMMSAIRFSDVAEWHVGPTPTPVEQFIWPDLDAAGGTSTAKAIRMLSKELETLPKRQVPPVCVLMSDGYCTDSDGEYDAAIAELNSHGWGKKSIRLAIGIGGADKDYNNDELLKFVSHPEIGVLQADTPEKLVRFIKWASLSASQSSVVGKTKTNDTDGNAVNVYLPKPPSEPVATSIASPMDLF